MRKFKTGKMIKVSENKYEMEIKITKYGWFCAYLKAISNYFFNDR